MDGFERLTQAIIVQATNDYRKALAGKRKNPMHEQHQKQIRECERFFRSAWFSSLCALDGEDLIHKLKKEVATV